MADGASGSGGVSGGRDAIPPAEAGAKGGVGGTIDVPSVGFDGPPSGGSTGSIDSPLVETEAGSLGGAGGSVDGGTGGVGGGTVDADIDVPLGGAGGAGRDGSLDADVRGSGGAGGAGTGGKGTGGSGSGGRGTGGSGSGGSGTGGSGTGGSGTGGSGTGGSGTGGSGTGGSGTGGSTDVVMAGLVIYYKCDETAGSTLHDSSGNDRTGTLVTGTGSGGYGFVPGQVNGALRLFRSSQGHVNIPEGALTGQTAMTIATWVKVITSADWQRVWDFGNNNTNVYMYLTPRNLDGFLRFAITTTSNTGEQGMNDDAELPVGEWHHVAVVLGSRSGILYLDGQQVANNDGMDLSPANLGSMTHSYIGRSQWAGAPYLDPYFDGSVDDFRVYNRALSLSEILTLVAYKGL